MQLYFEAVGLLIDRARMEADDTYKVTKKTRGQILGAESKLLERQHNMVCNNSHKRARKLALSAFRWGRV